MLNVGQEKLVFCSFIMISKANNHNSVDISREIIYHVLCFCVVWLFFKKCGHWASSPVSTIHGDHHDRIKIQLYNHPYLRQNRNLTSDQSFSNPASASLLYERKQANPGFIMVRPYIIKIMISRYKAGRDIQWFQ